MKTLFTKLILMTSLTITPAAFAAQLDGLDTLANPKLEAFAANLSKLEYLWPADSKLQINKFAFDNSASNEALINTVKQAIYVSRSDDKYSMPETVTFKHLSSSMSHLKEGIASAVTHMEYEAATAYIPVLAEELRSIVESNNAFEIFQLSDRNSFGFCESLAIVDQEAREILINSSCWSE